MLKISQKPSKITTLQAAYSLSYIQRRNGSQKLDSHLNNCSWKSTLNKERTPKSKSTATSAEAKN